MTQQGPGSFTYVDRAKADADDTAKGRWAGPASPTTHITGTIDGAPLPCPAWSAAEALPPPEPPYGECIDAVGDMTTVSGQDRATLEPPTLLEQIAATQAQLQALYDQVITNQNEEDKSLSGIMLFFDRAF
jgi:hypothetical protein